MKKNYVGMKLSKSWPLFVFVFLTRPSFFSLKCMEVPSIPKTGVTTAHRKTLHP